MINRIHSYIKLCILFGMFIAASSMTFAAETVFLEFGAKDKETELRLSIGKSQIIQSKSALEQVVIGNPEIADIKLLTSRQVLILGINPGRTNLVFRDKKKNLIAVMDVVVGYDLNGIKRKIADLLPEEEGIMVRGSNHSVILSGSVESLGAMDQAISVAKSYVPKERVINLLEVAGGQQVMLEVHMAEVSRKSLRQLGVGLDYQDTDGNPVSFVTGQSLSNAFSVLTGTDFMQNGTRSITASIDALEQQGLAKILAEPNLVALSGQQASFLAGGEIPIPVAQTSTVSGTVITVDYKEFGVGLKFTPTVLSNNKINIKLNTEVSDIDTSDSFSNGLINIPTILTRRAGTTIEMADGQSFAIAGLMQSDMNNAINQVPVLGSIPVLGSLFQSTDFQRRETELVIVVTPRLVSPVTMEDLILPTDNLIPPNMLDQYLLGKLEHRYVWHEKGYKKSAESSDDAGLEGQYGHELEGEKQ